MEWCLSILEDEHVSECMDEAEEIACKEYYASEAYEDLLSLLVTLRLAELERESTNRSAVKK